MQFSWTKSTMPFEYCTIAPGAGQALRQPGSSQCMQPSLRISHSRFVRLRVLPFGEAHQREHVRRQVGRIVVDADIDADLRMRVVPLQAGRLAGLAADAFGDVDELGDLASAAAPARGPSRPSGGSDPSRRNAAPCPSSMGWGLERTSVSPPYATGAGTGSILTRNALYSGVSILASPT